MFGLSWATWAFTTLESVSQIVDILRICHYLISPMVELILEVIPPPSILPINLFPCLMSHLCEL